jgi:hypothetical protein
MVISTLDQKYQTNTVIRVAPYPKVIPILKLNPTLQSKTIKRPKSWKTYSLLLASQDCPILLAI